MMSSGPVAKIKRIKTFNFKSCFFRFCGGLQIRRFEPQSGRDLATPLQVRDRPAVTIQCAGAMCVVTQAFWQDTTKMKMLWIYFFLSLALWCHNDTERPVTSDKLNVLMLLLSIIIKFLKNDEWVLLSLMKGEITLLECVFMLGGKCSTTCGGGFKSLCSERQRCRAFEKNVENLFNRPSRPAPKGRQTSR